MKLKRRHFLLKAFVTSGALCLRPELAYSKNHAAKNITLGITLEPPGLDPTVSAASSIAEITLYNLYETLTKIAPDGSVQPLLAESWEVSEDLRRYTFNLKKDVRFHNGAAFNAETVRFSLDRARADNSTNKDKTVYANIEQITVLDEHTVQFDLIHGNSDLLFYLGLATAIMVEPQSAEQNRATPIGTGPYRFDKWRRGALLSVNKWPEHRDADHIFFEHADFMFISDPAAQMAALLSGDIDIFARAAIVRGLTAFKRQPDRFQVIQSNSWAKTLLAINNNKAPLNDVRVRAAIASAIDRSAIVEAAADGLGQPIGSHYAHGMPGFIDTTDIYPYNPELARSLLKEAGVSLPLKLSLKLPPAPYARQGGEIIAAMLGKVDIQVRIENVEWGQWLSNIHGGVHDYDLTMISHVEPLDLGNYAKANYYWGYQNTTFNELYKKIQQTEPGQERNDLLEEAQKMLAYDAVNAWLYQPQWITVANKQIEGLWKDMPIFVNDLSSLRRGI